MIGDHSWETYVEKADAYKDIGQAEIYLYGDHAFPWHLATGGKAGSTHRIDIATSFRFFGQHESGLVFEWNFEIERDANGPGVYAIDTEAIATVRSSLPERAREAFDAYLRDCANKVRERGLELVAHAQRQLGDAALIEALVS